MSLSLTAPTQQGKPWSDSSQPTWTCFHCNQVNAPWRLRCSKCRKAGRTATYDISTGYLVIPDKEG